MVREYKDSNVDWIGQIPKKWKTEKFKHIFRIKKIIAGKLGYDVLSVTQQGLKVKNINEGQVANDYSNYQIVQVGDFVMNHMDLLTGYVDVSKQKGVTSPDYRSFNAIKKHEIDSRYYLYIFQFCYMTRIFYNLGHGVSNLGRWRLPAEQQNEFILPFPPLAEQRLIANYLDKKCSEIDSLVELQEQMIAQLTDYKQSVITEAITKGINSNATFVASGIDWIGKIPKGWEICRFKSYINLQNEKASETAKIKVNLENIESKSGRYIPSDSQYEGEGTSFKKGDVLFGKLRPYLAKVLAPDFEGAAMGDIYVFRPTARIDACFLKFSLLADTFVTIVDSSTYGTKMPRANWEFISCVPIVVPPLYEQKNIASYLEGKCAEIDNLISVKRQKIDRLKDYKKSIIFEAVTGKIDIE